MFSFFISGGKGRYYFLKDQIFSEKIITPKLQSPLDKRNGNAVTLPRFCICIRSLYKNKLPPQRANSFLFTTFAPKFEKETIKKIKNNA